MNKNALKRLIVSIVADSSSSDESIDESERSEFSEEEVILKFYKEPPRKRNCIRHYFEEVVPTYNMQEFRTHFRISKELFSSLSRKFELSPQYKNLREDKRACAFKHMAIFMWFSAHEACSYRDLADRFDVSLWTVENVINRVTTFISNLADEVFKWPDETRKREISGHFKNKNGFPVVIGAIDGTRIVIDPPKKGKDDYIDRKGNYSLCLQGICDGEANFIDICIGFPGSVHDSRVLQNSPIFAKLEKYCGEYHLLGDSAYPCLKFLLTPYKDNGHLNVAQKEYNKKLSSSRVVIEHAFGMLKQRFRQLYYCKLRGVKKLCHFIRACCVLHNLANQSDIDFEDVRYDVASDMTPQTTTEFNQKDSSLGKAERDKICGELRLSNKDTS